MTAETLFNEIRIYLNDSQRFEYTDDELMAYLNNGLEYIETLLAERQSSITLSTLEYVSAPSPLPDDFLTVNKVVSDKQLKYKERELNTADYEYSIIGNQIIIGTLPATLYYFKTFDKVTDLADDIDIYKPLIKVLRDYVIVRALNRLEYNTQVEYQQLERINSAILLIARARDGMLTITRYNDDV